MSAIVTTNMRVHAAKQLKNGFADPTQNFYLFIGRTLPWENDNMPPTPVDCPLDEASAYREMASLKRINANDVSLVVTRCSWQSGTIYTQYSDDIDLFDPSSGLPPFYVITDALNVYKCLNNNGGVASNVPPTGTQTNVVTNADGYQWKYMYTVNSSDVLNFVTTEWTPVKTLTANDGSVQWSIQQSAIPGTVDRIDLISAGTQYTDVPTVAIDGDGSGAVAVAVVSGGNVVAIHVTATGQGYTWAKVRIVGGGVGSNGAAAKAVLSPVYGHGADPVSELGGFYVLINAKLIFDEHENFSVMNDFRRIGILKNPLLKDKVTAASDLDYCQATRLTFGTVSGTSFVIDEVVTGSISGARGVVLDYGAASLRLVEVVGTFVPGDIVVGASASGVLQSYTGTAVSATAGTLVLPNGASATADEYVGHTVRIVSGTGIGQTRLVSQYNSITRTITVSQNWSVTPNSTSVVSIGNIVASDITPYSGDILYMENRRPIARAVDQIENIKIVVSM